MKDHLLSLEGRVHLLEDQVAALRNELDKYRAVQDQQVQQVAHWANNFRPGHQCSIAIRCPEPGFQSRTLNQKSRVVIENELGDRHEGALPVSMVRPTFLQF